MLSINRKRSNKIKIIILSFLLLILLALIIYSVFSSDLFKSKSETPSESEQSNIEEIKDEDKSESETKKEDTPSDKDVKTASPTIKPKNDYSKLYPNLYCEKPKKQISPDKTIFLTFDDGPSERTSEVLDILKRNNIKATFFVVGNTTSAGKALMQRIVNEGHTIAVHTYTHNFKQIYASVESYLDDFYKIYKLIYETTGQKPTIFRFAGGSKNGFNKNNYRELIAEMTRRGFYYYDWNLSTGDAAQKALTPSEKCISNVLNYSSKYNSAVVLMHDAKPKTTTVKALQGLIDGLKKQGFSFQKLTNEIYPAPYSLIKPYA